MVTVPTDFRTELTKLSLRRKAELRLLPDRWFSDSGLAREAQRPPDGPWRTWLILAGRGFGKTRTGAEWVRWHVEHGHATRIALVGATAADVRDVMIEGESGLVAVCRQAGIGVRYEPGRRRVVFDNGAVAWAYSAEEPNRLRGVQHDLAWCDELAAWRYEDSWDQLQFGLRLGTNPRQVVTTTPRPIPLVRRLMADANTATTSGTTYDNLDNLAPAFRTIISRYENTRLGQQELYGRLLDDVEGSLWNYGMIEANRITPEDLPNLTRIVVAVDPQAGYTSERRGSERGSETGIIVAGRDANGTGYVLADLSGNLMPNDWASRVVGAYRHWGADRIIVETNQGGQMAISTLRTISQTIPVQEIRANRGKSVRAEPVAALYEQKRVRHVGLFPELEEQMATWVPGITPESPDRVDAMVYAVQALCFSPSGRVGWV